jgi:hypothetical protein
MLAPCWAGELLRVESRSWVERLTQVPYPAISSPRIVPRTTLQLLRQDYEQLERNQSVIRTPMAIGTNRFSRGLGTHSFSDICVKSPKSLTKLWASVGVDLNERYGVTIQIAAPFCARIDSGRPWTAVAFWFTNHTFEVIPEGFIPAGATPFEDFVNKLVAVKYVIDPGTPQERTVVFPNSHKLWTGIIDGYPTANTVTLGTLRPLRPGKHVIEVHWIFRAMHCDGFDDVIGENCLSAGDFLYDRYEIQVTPGQRS